MIYWWVLDQVAELDKDGVQFRLWDLELPATGAREDVLYILFGRAPRWPWCEYRPCCAAIDGRLKAIVVFVRRPGSSVGEDNLPMTFSTTLENVIVSCLINLRRIDFYGGG
jgi:hypothetical protein